MSMLPYSLTRSVDPTSEPLTTADAKTHLRVSGSDEDSYIDILIEIARRQLENDSRTAIITKTWVQKHHAFPTDGVIELRMTPVASVSSIQYVDINGDTQTFSSGDYTVDTSRGVVWLGYQKEWPNTRDHSDVLTITYVAGASAATQTQKHAMRFLIAHWFENRSPAELKPFFETPLGYQVLVSQIHPGSYP